jgi:tetratricopeptide (TPR) repeat protein
MMREALSIDEAFYGPDHPNVAVRLGHLALLLQTLNRPAEAEPLMRRALEIDEAFFGPYRVEVAFRLGNLGRLLCAEGKSDEGKQSLERALTIFVTRYGDDHPYTLEARRRLAETETESPLQEKGQ